MANRHPSNYLDIGLLGEELVVQWLQSTGWVILHHRWRCPRGEIDIIARLEPQEKSDKHPLPLHSLPMLVFVEVKTRSRGNWDLGGLLSITQQKQAKLWQAARWFLASYPHLADYTCRFDVALVCCQRSSKKSLHESNTDAGYQLFLQDYIPSAFESRGG